MTRIQKGPRSARDAFTLVELLVVISVLMILLCLVLPSLGRAREVAESNSCLSVVRTLAATGLAYANENNSVTLPGYVPVEYPNVPTQGDDHTDKRPDSIPDGGLTWDEMVMNFSSSHTSGGGVGGDPKLVQCPAGPSENKVMMDDVTTSAEVKQRIAAHYAMNCRWNSTGWIGASWWDVSQVRPAGSMPSQCSIPMRTVMWGDPSGTIFWIESCREGGWFAGLDPSVNPAQSSAQRAPILAMKNSGNALATSCVQQGLETYWQRKHGQKANDPSTGRASILFCDGHAGQYIPEATIGADKKDSQGNPGSMNDADAGSGTVRGMWTNLGGD